MAKRINEKGRTLSCLSLLSDAGYFFGSAFIGLDSAFALSAVFLAGGLAQVLTNCLRSSPFSFFSSACLLHACCRFCAAVGSFFVDFSAVAGFFSCAMAVMLAAANTAATIKDSSLLISFS